MNAVTMPISFPTLICIIHRERGFNFLERGVKIESGLIKNHLQPIKVLDPRSPFVIFSLGNFFFFQFCVSVIGRDRVSANMSVCTDNMIKINFPNKT